MDKYPLLKQAVLSVSVVLKYVLFSIYTSNKQVQLLKNCNQILEKCESY